MLSEQFKGEYINDISIMLVMLEGANAAVIIKIGI